MKFLELIKPVESGFNLGRALSNSDALRVMSTEDILIGSKDFKQLFYLLNNLRLPQTYITQVYDDILKLKRCV